jgi:hypothetical protein
VTGTAILSEHYKFSMFFFKMSHTDNDSRKNVSCGLPSRKSNLASLMLKCFTNYRTKILPARTQKTRTASSFLLTQIQNKHTQCPSPRHPFRLPPLSTLQSCCCAVKPNHTPRIAGTLRLLQDRARACYQFSSVLQLSSKKTITTVTTPASIR